MKTHSILTPLALLLLGLVPQIQADVTPNSLFSDHAVLQRDKKIPIWGTAAEGEKVKVEFAGQKVQTVAKGGRWKVELQPIPASSEGRVITFTGNNTVTVNNVLVGEVWVCSGQSNMEASMAWLRKVSPSTPADIASSTDPLIRILRVPRHDVDEPQTDAATKWYECSPESVTDFSSVAYFFGRDLRKRLGVPVGLIGSYEGGTSAEAWTDRATLSGDSDLKALLEAQARLEAQCDLAKLEEANNKLRADYEAAAAKALAEGKPKPNAPALGVPPQRDKNRPACLYNGMIAPLQPYAIRGVIWYQGESNSNAPVLYRKLFPAMIASWRQRWGQGDFPFLFVQIAPCKRWSPGLREAQLLTWKSTANTAMVVTTDIGDAEDSHPRKKEPVGTRLALAARALAYGEKIEYSGPEFDSMFVRENRAVIHFKHTGGGLVAKEGDLKGFFIAGADGNFWPAKAEIKGDTVEVFSEKVPAPAAVRYGWASVPDVNLCNKEGLSASPFRTDVSDSFVFRTDFTASGAVDLLTGEENRSRVSLANGARWVNGGVEIDTTTDAGGIGHNYLMTSPAKFVFEPGQRYRISYEYSVKAGNDDWPFYHSFEGGSLDGKAPQFRESWQAEPRSSGQREFTISVTRPDAKLMLGVRTGAIRIEKINIKKLESQVANPLQKALVPSASGPGAQPMAEGPFRPTWESLVSKYQVPVWFRDAKFGIWAHWGPQAEPEDHSDWYARLMYVEGSDRYKFHVREYGHPSKVGFKEIIHQWKAANFDPDKLLAFYKKNGARYFMALANHHDNFDLWDSKYQPWNSVAIGPKKDLIAGWAAAARKLGLPFGVSVHASRAWKWYESSQGADATGPLAGIPYDGNLTKADGKGQWWEGLDPQDLYAQNHKPTVYARDGLEVMKTLITPGDNVSPAFCENFTLRTLDLIDRYKPDLVYFDEPVLPMRDGPESYGLRVVSHFYNSQLKWHDGRNEGVINTKRLNEQQRKALVYDIESGKAEGLLSEPWQTDTTLGKWDYSRTVAKNKEYKTAQVIVPMLVDIVSKNGNLMLNVPLRRDGTPDEEEVQIVSDIGAWLKVNGDSIFATRPWKVYGEGPSTKSPAEKGEHGGIKDTTPYTPEDVRFTQSKDGKTLYASTLSMPTGPVRIQSLGSNAKLLDKPISSISLLGSDAKLDWKQEADALVIQPVAKWPCEHAVAFKITTVTP